MTIPGQGSEDTQELRVRLSRYNDGGLIRKAAMRLAGEALAPEDLELLRRRDIGVQGRVCEDVLRAVSESEPIWALLAEKGLPEDLTVDELDAISDALRGSPRSPETRSNPVSASMLFTDPRNVSTLRQIIPGDLEPYEVTGYRYAFLTAPDFGSPEPFVVALRSHQPGRNSVTATMLVAATFLRHEQEFGVLSEDAAERLEVLVRLDLQEIIRTHQLLLEA
ncbi:hypothetical protein [Jatrophihabitans sp.]|jgi:hypothetical protein|uniref:hypothetical protein n=1 Tax=Jatrophihabitans sp. TaxID=1932789 RepID=UPI002F179FD1